MVAERLKEIHEELDLYKRRAESHYLLNEQLAQHIKELNKRLTERTEAYEKVDRERCHRIMELEQKVRYLIADKS